MSTECCFSLLIKPASADCNLRCDYCFYSSRSQLYPETTTHRMPDEVLTRMIASYMATDQPQYVFGWQGGEPTLMGVVFFRRVTELQQKYGRPGAVVANGLQTNATLITDELASHLAEYHIAEMNCAAIYIVGAYEPGYARGMGMKTRATFEEALKDAVKYVGPNPNILALPKTFKLAAAHLGMKDEKNG